MQFENFYLRVNSYARCPCPTNISAFYCQHQYGTLFSPFFCCGAESALYLCQFSIKNEAWSDKCSEQYQHKSIKKHQIYGPISTKKIPQKCYEMSNPVHKPKDIEEKVSPPPSQSFLHLHYIICISITLKEIYITLNYFINTWYTHFNPIYVGRIKVSNSLTISFCLNYFWALRRIQLR